MVSQKDIFITAQMLIKEYGDEADDYVHGMMLSFIEKDDPQGAGVWLSIGQAIEDLRNKKQQGNLH